MSHDAILISICAGAALLLYVVMAAGRKIRAAVLSVGQRWDEGMKMAGELRGAYAEIKARQNHDENALREAVVAMTAAVEKFGLPLEAIPTILKTQVGGLMALRETVERFEKTVVGNTQGGHIEPDERREAGEDEIIRLMDSAAAKGQRMSREEAIERLESKNLWSSMRSLIPTGSDD